MSSHGAPQGGGGGRGGHHGKPHGGHAVGGAGADKTAKDRRRERVQQSLQAPVAVRAALPRQISVTEYTAARVSEMSDFARAVQDGTSTRRVYQTVPRHLRRRAMSHNAHRLPRKLRASALKEMAKMSKPDTPAAAAAAAASRYSEYTVTRATPKSRRARRAPATLLRARCRRAQKHTWLETHLWHARRMHMGSRWGYRVALRTTDKSSRALVRAAQHAAVAHDLSYLQCVELAGPRVAIAAAVNAAIDPAHADAARALLAALSASSSSLSPTSTVLSPASAACVTPAGAAAAGRQLAEVAGAFARADYDAVVRAAAKSSRAPTSGRAAAAFAAAEAVAAEAFADALASAAGADAAADAATVSALPLPLQRALHAARMHSALSPASLSGACEGALTLHYPSRATMAAAKAILLVAEAAGDADADVDADADIAGAGAGAMGDTDAAAGGAARARAPARFPLSALLPLELAGQAIGPATFMWRPPGMPHSSNDNHGDCLSGDAASPSAAESESESATQLWLWLHPACAAQTTALLSALAAARSLASAAVAAEAACAAAPGAAAVDTAPVTVRSLAGELARIRVVGPRALTVLQSSLRAHPEASVGAAEPLARSAEPAAAATPQTAAPAARVWRGLAGARGAGAFVPAGALLGLRVTHPRALLARQRYKAPAATAAGTGAVAGVAVPAAANAPGSGTVSVAATLSKLTSLAPAQISQYRFDSLPAESTAATVAGGTPVDTTPTPAPAPSTTAAGAKAKTRLAFNFGLAVTKFAPVSAPASAAAAANAASAAAATAAVASVSASASASSAAASGNIAASFTDSASASVSASASALWSARARAVLSAASPLGVHTTAIGAKAIAKTVAKATGATAAAPFMRDADANTAGNGHAASAAPAPAAAVGGEPAAPGMLSTPLARALLSHSRPQTQDAGLGYWYPSAPASASAPAADTEAAVADVAARALVTERTHMAARLGQTKLPNLRGSLVTHVLLVHAAGFEPRQPTLPLQQPLPRAEAAPADATVSAAAAAAKRPAAADAAVSAKRAKPAAASGAAAAAAAAASAAAVSAAALPALTANANTAAAAGCDTPAALAAALAGGDSGAAPVSLPPLPARGYLAGWDIILPAGWASALFSVLVHSGARAVGVEDLADLYSEALGSAPCLSVSAAAATAADTASAAAAAVPAAAAAAPCLFPRLWPGTLAGRQWAEHAAARARLGWFRAHKARPPVWALAVDAPTPLAAVAALTAAQSAGDGRGAIGGHRVTVTEASALALARPHFAWAAAAAVGAAAPAAGATPAPPVLSEALTRELGLRAQAAYRTLRRSLRQSLKNRRKRLHAKAAKPVSAASAATSAPSATAAAAAPAAGAGASPSAGVLLQRLAAAANVPRWFFSLFGYSLVTSLLPNAAARARARATAHAAAAGAITGATLQQPSSLHLPLPFPLPSASPLAPLAFPPEPLLAKRSAASMGLDDLPSAPVPLDAALVARWTDQSGPGSTPAAAAAAAADAPPTSAPVLLPTGVSPQNHPPPLQRLLVAALTPGALLPPLANAAAADARTRARAAAATHRTRAPAQPVLLLSPALARAQHAAAPVDTVLPAATLTGSLADPAVAALIPQLAAPHLTVPQLAAPLRAAAATPAALPVTSLLPPHTLPVPAPLLPAAPTVIGAWRCAHPALLTVTWLPPATASTRAAGCGHVLPSGSLATLTAAVAARASRRVAGLFSSLCRDAPAWASLLLAASALASASTSVPALVFASVSVLGRGSVAAGAVLALPTVTCYALHAAAADTAAATGGGSSSSCCSKVSARADVVCAVASDSVLWRRVATATATRGEGSAAHASRGSSLVGAVWTCHLSAAAAASAAVCAGVHTAAAEAGVDIRASTMADYEAVAGPDAEVSAANVVRRVAGAASLVAPAALGAAPPSQLLRAYTGAAPSTAVGSGAGASLGPEEPPRALSADEYLALARPAAPAGVLPAPPVSRQTVGVALSGGFSLTRGRARAPAAVVTATGFAAAAVRAITGRPLARTGAALTLPHPAALPEELEKEIGARWTAALPAGCPSALAAALRAFGSASVTEAELCGIVEGVLASGVTLALPPPALVPVLVRNPDSRQYVIGVIELPEALI
jgi:hypothetical protein